MAIILGGSPRREESSPPQYAKAPDLIIPMRPYDARFDGDFDDTLFRVNPTDEVQVVREGGVLTTSYSALDPAMIAADNVASLVDFALSPGRKAVQAGNSVGHVMYELNGSLAEDEWTVADWFRPVGVDATALPAIATPNTYADIWGIEAGYQRLTLRLRGGSPVYLEATLAVDTRQFLVAGADDLITARVPIAVGASPADAWTAVTVCRDATNGLSIILGGDSAPSSYWDLIYVAGVISSWSMWTTSGTEPDYGAEGGGAGASPGTYLGGAVTRGVDGAIRGTPDPAVRFSGLSGAGYLDVGNDASLQISTGTIEGWINVAGSSPTSYAFSIANKLNAYGLVMVDGNLRTHDYSTDTPRSTPTLIDDAEWHHIALTFAPGANNTKVYVDGALVLTTTTGVLNQTQSLTLGRPQSTFPTGDLQVSLDEWNVYSSVLTLSDMQDRYAFRQYLVDSNSTSFPLTRPWSAETSAGSLRVLASAGTPPVDQGLQATVPTIYRYSRLLVRQNFEDNDTSFMYRDAPKLTVGASLGDWTPGIGGIVGLSSDYGDELGGDLSGATGNAQWQMIGDAGCPLVRTASNFELAPITALNGASPPTIDFTNFDAYYQRILDVGITQVHGMVGFTPEALWTAGYTSPPTDFTTFAQWASAVVGRMLSLGIDLVSLSFWNEPHNQWHNSDELEFADLWWECAQLIAADYPTAPKLGGPDADESEAFGNATPPNYLTAIIDRAETEGFDLGSAYLHCYDFSMTRGMEQVDSVTEYVAGKFTPECPVRIGEFNYGLLMQGGAGTTLHGDKQAGYALTRPRAFPTRLREGLYEAPWIYKYLWEAMEHGVDVATYFVLGGSIFFPGLISGESDGTTGLPKPFPVFSMYSLLWKHEGERFECDSTFPWLRGIYTVADDGTITLTYCAFKGAGTDTSLRFGLEWPTDLPASYTWKQWQLDDDTPDLARLLPIATGNQDNLPLSVRNAGRLGVGCVQITP